ncbi:hypothetical protein ACRAWF_00845, partial [Streptomyces sp. L7]
MRASARPRSPAVTTVRALFVSMGPVSRTGLDTAGHWGRATAMGCRYQHWFLVAPALRKPKHLPPPQWGQRPTAGRSGRCGAEPLMPCNQPPRIQPPSPQQDDSSTP